MFNLSRDWHVCVRMFRHVSIFLFNPDDEIYGERGTANKPSNAQNFTKEGEISSHTADEILFASL